MLVTPTTRASEPERDRSNLSAASQANSHTMRRSQTYIYLRKIPVRSRFSDIPNGDPD